jgi:L-2-hydroxyglutarate oxidase LhgO
VRQERQHLVRNLIYPVPDLQFPFLGVHFTRLIHGGLEAGPNAVLAASREGYKKSDFNLRDTFEALTYPGLYRFAKRHFRMCVAETARSYSKKLFCHALQRLVPDITLGDLEPGGAGVRAQAMNADGYLVGDFQLSPGPGSLHVINAPSPAATASLAIGEQVAQIVSKMRGDSTDLATLPDFLSLTT